MWRLIEMARKWLGNIRGPKGPQGEQGEKGPQGPQGIQGPKGEKGDIPNMALYVKADKVYTKEETDSKINGKADKQELNKYLPKETWDSRFGFADNPYVDSTKIIFSPTTKQLNIEFDKPFIKFIGAKLIDYYDKNACDDLFQKKGNYALKSDIPKTQDLTLYAKKADIAKAVTYKGSVNSYSDLPKSVMAVGDMYNIATADHTNGIKAGDNVVYNGNSWDNMGGTIDLSGYAMKTDLGSKQDKLEFATEQDIKALF